MPEPFGTPIQLIDPILVDYRKALELACKRIGYMCAFDRDMKDWWTPEYYLEKVCKWRRFVMLSLEEKATNFDTMLHIHCVAKNINKIVKALLERGEKHDLSKLAAPEVKGFTEETPKLASIVFGSKEYAESLERLKPALDHHYAANRHHPQYHANGINDMNLIDILEMFCDWYASSKRNKNGDLRTSIGINAGRFEMSDQLANIFRNTVEILDNERD